MGDFNKHLRIAKEKLDATVSAFKKGQHTVVGDLATKVIEQLVEADAARKNEHFGDHRSRHDWANKNYPRAISKAMRRVWFAYGDLGYDGSNGKRAQVVMKNLRKVVEYFEKEFGVQIYEKNT